MDDLDLGQTIRGFVAGQRILNRYTFLRILAAAGWVSSGWRGMKN